MGRPRASQLLGVAGVALFVASTFTPLPNLLARWAGTAPQLEPSDAIVVLGGDFSRAIHGIVLYRKDLAPLLVFSGPANDEGEVEAELLAEFARNLGVPPDRIMTEVEARTTREEATRLGALLRPRGVRRILLVTDSLHMARASQLFERVGFRVYAAPSDDFSDGFEGPEARLVLMRIVLLELLARLYYRLAGYL
jgi:uncharacterized SAM-binding protein YcdF (DUF218 family)